MISNPAKMVYMKFDLAAQLMAKGESVEEAKEKLSGGLLRRITMPSSTTGKETKEPLDIAMEYFVAIRKERNALKNKQDT